MIFADHDINPNTDFDNMKGCYAVIKELFPTADIISGVNIMGSDNETGSVYPNPPFKNKPVEWFYKVDNFLPLEGLPKTTIASHGLIHVDHTKIDTDAQEMSIVVSCNLLGAKMFIPPFNKFNEDTLQICEDNKIEILLTSHGWKSLEFNKFDINYDKWYFHSWRYTPETLKEALSAKNSVKLGLL